MITDTIGRSDWAASGISASSRASRRRSPKDAYQSYALAEAFGEAGAPAPFPPPCAIRRQESRPVAETALGVVEEVELVNDHAHAGSPRLEAEVDVIAVKATERRLVEAEVAYRPRRQRQ